MSDHNPRYDDDQRRLALIHQAIERLRVEILVLNDVAPYDALRETEGLLRTASHRMSAATGYQPQDPREAVDELVR